MATEAQALAEGYVVDRPRPEDRDGWAEMWAGYCSFYAVADAAGKAAVVWPWLMDPAHPVKGFVARDPAGAVVGLAHYRAFHRPIAAGVGCFFDDLFVAPQTRGTGVAAALIARVAAEAEANGWGVVRWITAEDNSRARALYDRVATKTHWVTYEIRP